MKIKKIIPLILLLLCGVAKTVIAQDVPQPFGKDSTIDVPTPVTVAAPAPVNLTNADSVIEEVAKSNTVPKQKIQYISEVTKYGFKNLFSNYNYNPNLSYNVQVNPNAEQFIQDYMKTHGSYLEKMKDWGVPYFNFIESVLRQYGLPRELKYIAVIESNLQTTAVSEKGACGPWQLMPETACHLGLTINKYVDERTDYYKSTNAAAKYLLSLYGQLNDWLLVMAAYNGGMGTVLNAIKKSNSRDFWKLQFYLPEESRNYVKRFIATHYIMEGMGGVTTTSAADIDDSLYNNNYNYETNTTTYAPSKGNNPYGKRAALVDSEQANVKELTISGKYSGTIIAKHLSMTMMAFKHYNPAFDNIISSTGSYELRLPSDKMDLFIADKYPILNESITALLGSLTAPVSKTYYPRYHATKKKRKVLTH
jgi:peptidoglycan lytic transglycosylase D